MSRLLRLAVCSYGMIFAGCGAQSILLGTEGSYLLTVMDSLALPNAEVQLRARLQGGDLLQAQAGHVVRFYRNAKLFKATETDSDGVAAVSFVPTEPGDYRFMAEVAPAGLPDKPPAPQELLIVCRKGDSRMLVVDLDKTVVASGFHMVLIGKPTPMPGSSELLRRLASTHVIVYLTHRPDYFGLKSKRWLREHRYPAGPVLLSSVSGFLKGSGAYKSQMLRDLMTRFKKIEIGIGDKVSDAAAYHENGLKSFLIVQIPQSDDAQIYENLADNLKTLPEAVQVVTDWNQIDKALFGEASFPRVETERSLREMARARRVKPEAAKQK